MKAAFRSLRYRNARLFFGGLAVSNVGTWMQMTAMSLLVFRLTGEATAVGITVACQFLPMLLSKGGPILDETITIGVSAVQQLSELGECQRITNSLLSNWPFLRGQGREAPIDSR